MRKFTATELAEILEKHGKWLRDEDGGEKANLRYADLSYADMRYADLSYADLSYADLSYADLSYANLRYANLRSADMRYANLSYAKNQIYIGQRSDGYRFFAKHDKEKDCWMIHAGCLYFTAGQYRAHTEKYYDEQKRAETLALIDLAETMIKIRGIVE